MKNTYLKILEALIVTFVFCTISFLLPLIWNTCTPVPTQTASWTSSERELLDQLVRFECPANYYNQVASLYFVPADTAMQQMVSCLMQLVTSFMLFCIHLHSFIIKSMTILPTQHSRLGHCCYSLSHIS